MTRAAKKAGRRWPGDIEIDVPGVTRETRLSDLTVEQFVEVLAAVLQQTARPRAVDPREIERVVEQIRKATEAPKGKPTALQKSVRDAQSAIVAHMPDIARETGSKQGGPGGSSGRSKR